MDAVALSCPRCSADAVPDGAYCHRCGASLAARRRPRAHVAGVLLVALLAAALAWAVATAPATLGSTTDEMPLLVDAARAPPGTEVAPLPPRYADALGVATNPAPLPAEGVDGFTESFGVRPNVAWVQFVSNAGTDDGVLAFSFRWDAAEDASAAARAFVASAGCSDVDVALAGDRDLVALVAAGATQAALAPTVDAVARALAADAPALRDVCAAPLAAPVLPDLRLDRARASGFARGEPLAVLTHAGGPPVDWSEAGMRLSRDGAPTVAVTFSATGDCADAALVPSGAFAAGQEVLLCAADGRWEPGARLGARVVARDDGRVVWSGDVALV